MPGLRRQAPESRSRRHHGEVTLRNVVKAYGANEGIHGIDLEIRSGEFVAFVGPSGSGILIAVFQERVVGGLTSGAVKG